MRKLAISLVVLLFASESWAGTNMSKISQQMNIIQMSDMAKEMHKVHYLQGLIVQETFKGEGLKQIKNAATFNNYQYANNYAQILRGKLHDEIAKSSSPIDIADVDAALGRIIIKTKHKQPFKTEAEELQKIVWQMIQAKEASQKALSPEEIRQLAQAANDVKQKAKDKIGASVQASCVVTVIK